MSASYKPLVRRFRVKYPPQEAKMAGVIERVKKRKVAIAARNKLREEGKVEIKEEEPGKVCLFFVIVIVLSLTLFIIQRRSY